MMITEYEPKLCPNCQGTGTCPDGISTGGGVCKLCGGTGKITITRVIGQAYSIDKPIEPPYKITC